MKFILADVPPARQDRTSQQNRRQFLPNESLDTLRLYEVLLELGQNIWEISKRADKTSASASRRTLAKELRRLPDRLHAHDCFCSKFVGAHEERIVMQSLGAGWLIIGIIQTHKSVSQERSELPASPFELGVRSRAGPEHLCQVGPHLHIGVLGVIDFWSPFRSLAASENRSRHLEFP